MFEASEDFDDDELQEDEEELLVYVEFPNCDENSMFGIERLKLDILGIDTETPIIQVNGKVSLSFWITFSTIFYSRKFLFFSTNYF